MKNIHQSVILLLFLTFACPYSALAQDSPATELTYEVNRIYPPLSITKHELREARTLLDLNIYYKPSWVKEYISVEITASSNGQIRKAMSKNDTLSQEQKKLMNSADVSTDISIIAQYIPDNNLKHNEIKELDFTFNLIPESEATYHGGQEELMSYLKVNAIDKIPANQFKDYDLAVIKFTVDENGQVIDTHVFQPSKYEVIDTLLLNTICSMPDWEPAEYSNGLKVRQDFAFAVGNMENCMLNLINIRPNRFAMSNEDQSRED